MEGILAGEASQKSDLIVKTNKNTDYVNTEELESEAGYNLVLVFGKNTDFYVC